MGIVAKYFGGATPFEYLGKKTFREIWELYKIYEFQVTWDNVIEELSQPKPPKRKALPSYERIESIVESRIKEARNKK